MRTTLPTHATTAPLRRGMFSGVFFALTAITSHAAVVNWGAAQAITGDSDVITAGPLVVAQNLGGTGVANTTVNGTTFTGVAASGGTNGLGTAASPFGNLSSEYQALLSSAYAPGGSGSFTVNVNLLLVGATYEFEWWSNDSVGPNAATTATSGGSAVTLGSNPTGNTGGLGQFATGTFIADATTQSFVFTGASNLVLDGFEMRRTAVPEPGSALLLALGVCLIGMSGHSRRQTAEA